MVAILLSCLYSVPICAFYMYAKGVSAGTAATVEFVFVLVDAPQLAGFIGNKTDPAAFSNQLESKKCVAQSTGCQFQNLSGDAVLVAPKPLVSLPALLASSSSATTTLSSSVAAAADPDGMRKKNAQQLLLPYAHLANFVRQAPAHQVTGLWQMAASAYLEALQLGKNNNEEDSVSSSTGSRRNNRLMPNLKKRQRNRSVAAKPVWFSTSGMGVAWLHFRLDKRPKYYTYRAFAEET